MNRPEVSRNGAGWFASHIPYAAFVGLERHKEWGFFEMPGGRFVRHDQREPATQRSPQ